MTTDPKECSENPKRCVALASDRPCSPAPPFGNRPRVDAICFRFGQNGLEVGKAKRQASGLSPTPIAQVGALRAFLRRLIWFLSKER